MFQAFIGILRNRLFRQRCHVPRPQLQQRCFSPNNTNVLRYKEKRSFVRPKKQELPRSVTYFKNCTLSAKMEIRRFVTTRLYEIRFKKVYLFAISKATINNNRMTQLISMEPIWMEKKRWFAIRR